MMAGSLKMRPAPDLQQQLVAVMDQLGGLALGGGSGLCSICGLLLQAPQVLPQRVHLHQTHPLAQVSKGGL